MGLVHQGQFQDLISGIGVQAVVSPNGDWRCKHCASNFDTRGGTRYVRAGGCGGLRAKNHQRSRKVKKKTTSWTPSPKRYSRTPCAFWESFGSWPMWFLSLRHKDNTCSSPSFGKSRSLCPSLSADPRSRSRKESTVGASDRGSPTRAVAARNRKANQQRSSGTDSALPKKYQKMGWRWRASTAWNQGSNQGSNQDPMSDPSEGAFLLDAPFPTAVPFYDGLKKNG